MDNKAEESSSGQQVPPVENAILNPEQHSLSKKQRKRLERQKRWAETEKKKHEEKMQKRRAERERKRAEMTAGFDFTELNALISSSFSILKRGTGRFRKKKSGTNTEAKRRTPTIPGTQKAFTNRNIHCCY